MDIMLEGTLAAFQRTSDYLEGFSQLFAHVIKETALKTAKMLGALEEQAAALNLEALMDNIKDEDLNRLLGIPADSPEKPGWWYPVLEKALYQFAFGVCSDPVPTTPKYQPSFCNSLEKFVGQLRGQAGTSSRGFEQFSMEPPLPSGFDASAFEDPASSSAAVSQLLALYRNEKDYTREALKLLDMEQRLCEVDDSDTLSVFEEGGPSGEASDTAVGPVVPVSSAPAPPS